MKQLYQEYLSTMRIEEQKLLSNFADLIYDNIPNVKFKIWSNYPTFYIENNKRIVFAFFKGYCNIFAEATVKYKEEITKNYFMHPKGMIKFYFTDVIDKPLFLKIFMNSL